MCAAQAASSATNTAGRAPRGVAAALAARTMRARYALRGGWLGRISTRLSSARDGMRSRSITVSPTSSGVSAHPDLRLDPDPNSVAPLPHLRNRLAAAVEDAVEVRLDERLPVRDRHLGERAEVADPGVVDQDVGGAGLLGDLR